MTRTVCTWALCLCPLVAGCGGTDDGESENASEPDQPLELSETTFGVTVRHGEAGVLDPGDDPDQGAIDGAREVSGTAFLHLQSYDEHTWLFGDWEVHPPSGNASDYRKAGTFRSDPDLARFENRLDDLVEEVEGTFGAFGGDGFDELGVIFDVWRMRDDWYVRWDGNLDNEENRTGTGGYGFYRSDMTDDLVSQLAAGAETHGPEYLVVGTDMGRLLAREDEPGIAPEEFSNFRQFYERVVAEIREVSPSTKLGVGFDWDRFAREIAPAYGEGSPGEVPPRETLRRAFEALIYPLAEAGGMVALKSYRAPGEHGEHYRFLADLDETYDMEGISVVWYSVGSPVNDSVSYRQQRTYLQNFIEWNEGVEPDVVVWRSLLNMDGADTGDQQIDGRCDALVDDEKGYYQLDVEHCFDGLFDAAFRPKEVFQFVRDESSAE